MPCGPSSVAICDSSVYGNDHSCFLESRIASLIPADAAPTEASSPVSFELPPVSELVFAVQFASGIVDLEVLGTIARSFKMDFPVREQHPPLPPMIERFEPGPETAHIIFKTQPDLPRTFFISNDSERLIQVQADRFAFNWRKTHPAQIYPRYGSLRPEFVRHLHALMGAAAEVEPTAPPITICELSYVNELVLEDVELGAPHPQIGRFVHVISPIKGESFLPNAEDARLQARWRIPDADGRPIGRLYVSVEPAYRRADNLPMYVMTMTARMVSAGADPNEALRLIDIGHDWIVRGFKDLTTKEMHAIWKLEEVEDQ
jgi:uncharacterized protein (TIGR04255 family)